jgi:hypothetical protein
MHDRKLLLVLTTPRRSRGRAVALAFALLAATGCSKDESSPRAEPSATVSVAAKSPLTTSAAPAASSLAKNDSVPAASDTPSPQAVPAASSGSVSAEANATASARATGSGTPSTSGSQAKADKKPLRADSEAAISLSNAQVKMLNAGAEPRSALRYHLAKGQSQSVSVVVSMGPQGTPLQPMMTVGMKAIVSEVTPENLIKADLIIDKFELGNLGGQLPPEQKAEFDKMAKSLMQVKHHLVLTDRGALKEDKLDAPKMNDPMSTQMIDSMKQVMTQVMASLPEEEVGTGAKWEESHDVSVSQAGVSLKLHSKATYELVSKSGDTVKLKVTMTGNADPMAGGAGGPQIDAMTIKGDGANELDLGKLLPQHSSMKTTTSITLKMGGKPMTQALDGEVKLSPR